MQKHVLGPLANLSVASGLATYSSLSSVQSCYVKMLTGRWCSDQAHELSIDDATTNLGLLDFVGLTSQWNASVCLFHEEFGLGPVDWDLEGQNTHPGEYSADFAITPDLQALLRANEKLDSDVYFAATGIFVQRVARYPQCASMIQYGRDSGLITDPAGW
jgi:hypothetical protein